MRRNSLWVLLGAGIAAVVGLLISLRPAPSTGMPGGTSAGGAGGASVEASGRAAGGAASGARDPASRAGTRSGAGGVPRGKDGEGPNKRPAPRLPEVAAPAATGAATGETPEPRVYVRENGAIVSDFRSNAPPPTLRGRSLRPQPEGLVEPTAILAVRNAMRPIVTECVARVPATSLGKGARLQSQVVIRIEGERLLVDEVTAGTRNVDENDAADLHLCIEGMTSALALDVAGHRDVSGYILRLPFRLGR